MTLSRIPFDEPTERRILSSARWAVTAAVVTVVQASLAIVAVTLGSPTRWGVDGAIARAADGIGIGMVPGLLAGAVGLSSAFFLILASRSLRMLATTDEADQRLLVNAAKSLRNAFFVKALLIITAILFWAVLLLMMSGRGGSVTYGVGL